METRRAKIVATVGPATEDRAMLLALARAGVDVFRLNFSHGTLEGHGALIERIREVRRECGRNIAILQDLPGPKVRLRELQGHRPVLLGPGAIVELTPQDVAGTERLLGVSYPYLVQDVTVGQRVLLDDGRLELEVIGAEGDRLVTRVIRGGQLVGRKGVNFPGAALRWPAMTERDGEALRFGLARGVDLVALSFVRSAADVDPVRALMREAGILVPVIAKIEKPQALGQLADIVRRFDGIMVARGDLGVEVPPEQVPMIQKRIVRRCREAGKPVIIATQMLESMTQAPRPTRAEASDVANAVLEGADAVMLSAETSVGQFPLEAVTTMRRIIEDAELAIEPGAPDQDVELPAVHLSPLETDSDAFARAAVEMALDVRARAIAVVTRSGRSARLVARRRPSTPVVVFTDDGALARQLALWWGLHVELLSLGGSIDLLTPEIQRLLEHRGLAHGDRVVIVGATPMAAGARTNFLKLVRLGRD